MSRFPVLKPKKLVSFLESMGFREIRQRGSHKQFRHPDGRRTTVAVHVGRDVSPIILRQIADDIGLSPNEVLSFAW